MCSLKGLHIFDVQVGVRVFGIVYQPYQLDLEIPQRSPLAANSRKESRESRGNLKIPLLLPVRTHRLRDRVDELFLGREARV
jgi:hypothetical protein